MLLFTVVWAGGTYVRRVYRRALKSDSNLCLTKCTKSEDCLCVIYKHHDFMVHQKHNECLNGEGGRTRERDKEKDSLQEVSRDKND